MAGLFGVLIFTVQNPFQKFSKMFLLRSGDIKSVKVHDLVPSRDKVAQEQLLRVLTSIDFRDGSELGVRTEDQVDTGAGPLEFARRAITPFEDVVGFRCCLPGRAHVEQVDEKVIGQGLWPLGEDAVLSLVEVGVQNAHTANQNRHLGSGQRH
jgi:hypothetical protein